MSEEIIKVLDSICDKFGIAIDWSQQNIMPYLQQLMNKIINYEIATSIAWIVVFVATLVVSFISIKYTIKYCDDDNCLEEVQIGLTVLSVVLVFLDIFAIVGIACQIFDIIQCYTLPEKTILDYALYYMKSE